LGGTEIYIFLPTNPSVTNERKTVEYSIKHCSVCRNDT